MPDHTQPARRLHRWIPLVSAAAVLPIPATTAVAAVHTSTARPAGPSTAAPVVACAAIAAVDISAAVGAGTGVVAAAPATAPGGYPVCDVKGVIAPQIQFEVQLPTQTYRQRYLQTGCGGLCGSRDQRPRTPARFI